MKTYALTILTAALIGMTAFSFAGHKSQDEIAEAIAQAYLDSAATDESWSETHPFIADRAVYYSDSEEPAYIEYKVSCDDKPNCGWIIVNRDGDDVAIPIASTQGAANFELLTTKLDGEHAEAETRSASKKRMLYYFSPFDQYIADENGDVAAINPADEAPSKQHLEDLKAKAKANKGSAEFKMRKQQLDAEGLTSSAFQKWFWLNRAIAAANTIPDTFVPGASTTNCGSRIPCYKYNATYTYPSGTCKFGCVPTAIAMIYGYHDRQGTYPNLITWGLAKDYIDSATTDTKITTMINSIRASVGTFCNSWEGSTPIGDAKLGIAYAKAQGYQNALATVETGSTQLLLNSIKVEINAGRPVLVGIQSSNGGHAVVAYGYSSDTTSKMIRVNYGAGRSAQLVTSTNPLTTVTAYNADINVNAASLTINTGATTVDLGTVTSITRFKIWG